MVPAAGVVDDLFAVVFVGVEDPPLLAPLGVPCGAPEVLAGVAAGVEDGGSDVSGVGSGGKGFVKMVASRSFNPASVVSEAFRNLYHSVSLSFHSVFLAAYAASVPARATARA